MYLNPMKISHLLWQNIKSQVSEISNSSDLRNLLSQYKLWRRYTIVCWFKVRHYVSSRKYKSTPMSQTRVMKEGVWKNPLHLIICQIISCWYNQKNWKCTTVGGLAWEGDDFSKTDFLKSSSVSILSDLNKSLIFGEFLLLIPVDNEDL